MAEPKYRAQLAGVGPTLLLVDLNADTLEQAQYEAAEVALDCGAAFWLIRDAEWCATQAAVAKATGVSHG